MEKVQKYRHFRLNRSLVPWWQSLFIGIVLVVLGFCLLPAKKDATPIMNVLSFGCLASGIGIVTAWVIVNAIRGFRR
ncbi:MAG: hypothetical protein FWC56_00240 [Phycisphaerae bacterium]|nr:hypothetical protein [Phycisphaerae bacterium]